jgi:ribosome recycling factor
MPRKDANTDIKKLKEGTSEDICSAEEEVQNLTSFIE